MSAPHRHLIEHGQDGHADLPHPHHHGLDEKWLPPTVVIIDLAAPDARARLEEALRSLP